VITRWIFYRVPEELRFGYVLGLVLSMLIIPEYILQIRLNIIGEFTNFLTFDLLFYILSKNIDINKEE
jgi:hypothetical protein